MVVFPWNKSLGSEARRFACSCGCVCDNWDGGRGGGGSPLFLTTEAVDSTPLEAVFAPLSNILAARSRWIEAHFSLSAILHLAHS